MKNNFLEQNDPEIFRIIELEEKRQEKTLELIASENIVSPAVLEAMGSILTNKYAEGTPSARYYGGCEEVDKIENIARDRLKELFGAEHANVQPHSGSQANQAVYLALLNPGDTVLALGLSEGGHLTHGSSVNASGKIYNFISYGLDKNHHIDYEQVKKLALEHKPKMIIAGGSAYSQHIDFKIFSDIAKSIEAYFMVDMAHYAGLIASGIYPNPVPYADVVTSTTHKTLRGPRGGIILCKKELAKSIDKGVFPGLQGGPLMHIIAAKAVCFKEALSPAFKEYSKQVVKNAQALAQALKEFGFDIITGGTNCHLILIDLRSKNITGKEAQNLLNSLHITTNKNSIPYETLSPMVTSGIRLGTPALTTRGMKEPEMKKIAQIINNTIAHKEDSAKLAEIEKEVLDLCDLFPVNKA